MLNLYALQHSQAINSSLIKKQFGIGSGKGNIVSSNDTSDVVYGVVFEVPKSEEKELDDAEGWKEDGSGGYEKEIISVNNNDEVIEVVAYLATRQEFIDENELPFDWYKNHCVKGAEEFGLPKQYVDFLKSFATKTDTNKKRVLEETSLYD